MPDQPNDYENLVEKLFDDRLAEAELDQLNTTLRELPEAREHYWHLVMLEGYLADLPGWIVGQQYATELAFSETLEAFIEMESNAAAELQHYPAASDVTNGDKADDKPITWQDVRMVGRFCLRSLAQQKATWGVAAAAMVCIVALVYANWFGGGAVQPPAEKYTGADQDTLQVLPLPDELATVAVVLNQTTPAGSSDTNTLAPGTALVQGQRITLQDNTAVQLAYDTGVTAILQGPGEFTLQDADRVHMAHGRISALVPQQGKGFTVSTAQTDFIDHGTEFAVSLDKQGHGSVVVLDGLIEAASAKNFDQASLEQPPSVMLHEGFGGLLLPDQAMPASVQPISEAQIARYTRNWDDVVYRPELSGEISYVATPPASLEPRQATSVNPMLIPERRGVVLDEDLHLNATKANQLVIQKSGLEIQPDQDYVIPAGTKLNSFLIHLDLPEVAAQGTVERNFKLRFNGRIVGIIEVQRYQFQTDKLLGLPSIQYPSEDTPRGAADPPGHPNFDYLYVSDDRRTLNVKMRLSGLDQIRVLVENTDP